MGIIESSSEVRWEGRRLYTSGTSSSVCVCRHLFLHHPPLLCACAQPIFQRPLALHECCQCRLRAYVGGEGVALEYM